MNLMLRQRNVLKNDVGLFGWLQVFFSNKISSYLQLNMISPPNSIVSSLANKQTRPDFLINAEKGKRKGLKRIQTIIR